jgi:hypothetical protein
MNDDTQAFKETAETISLHGLGFLQVKLGGKQRLHVWHPELPRRACFEHSAVHSHRFSFMSRILVGTQRNIIWSVAPGEMIGGEGEGIATHMSYRHEGERSEFGNRPWIEDGAVRVYGPRPSDHEAGTRYVMRMHDYHSTEPLGDGRVATLMLKTAEDTTRGALSLCELGVEPDVDFDRKQMSADQLWGVVREVLGG